MKRKIIVFLSILLILSLAACDGGKAGGKDTAENDTADTSVSSETEGPESTSGTETADPSGSVTDPVGTDVSETSAHETNAPDTSAPETKVPETSAPETNAPETSAPETAAPETSAPETEKQEQLKLVDNVNLVFVEGVVGPAERLVKIVSGEGYLPGSASLPASFPVFLNAYPYGQGGHLFTITEKMVSGMRGNLMRYVGMIYPDVQPRELSYPPQPDFPEIDDHVLFTRDSVEIRSEMTGISALLYGGAIPGNVSEADLLKNSFIKAALSYVGITEPAIRHTFEYLFDGSEYTNRFVIIQKTDDIQKAAEELSFASVDVSISGDFANIRINFIAKDSLKAEVCYPSPALSTVIGKLPEYYPNMVKDPGSVKAEILYNTSVDRPETIVPCIRLYFKDGVNSKKSNDLFTVVDMLIVP